MTLAAARNFVPAQRRPFVLRQVGFLCLFLALWVPGSQAQNMDQLAGITRSDLDTALLELSKVRQQIADEKLPLSRQLNELETQVIDKRR